MASIPDDSPMEEHFCSCSETEQAWEAWDQSFFDALQDETDLDFDELESDPQLEAALLSACNGMRIVPARPGTKFPSVTEWQHKATTNLQQILEWWRSEPHSNIFGIVPRESFILDFDVRNGGMESFYELENVDLSGGLLDDSLVTFTPTGGLHLWFDHPGVEVENSRKRLDESGLRGVDLLGPGHGIMMPGSTIGGKNYLRRLMGQMYQGEMPRWLVEMITKTETPERVAHPYDLLTRSTSGGVSPVEWFENRYDWTDILETMIPESWSLVCGDGNSDGSYWAHPTASHNGSATIKHGLLFCYSTTPGLPETSAGQPRGLYKFTVWCDLNGWTYKQGAGIVLQIKGNQ